MVSMPKPRHRFRAGVTGLETDHMHSLRTILTLSSNLCCTMHQGSSYPLVFQSERIFTNIAKGLLLYC